MYDNVRGCGESGQTYILYRASYSITWPSFLLKSSRIYILSAERNYFLNEVLGSKVKHFVTLIAQSAFGLSISRAHNT